MNIFDLLESPGMGRPRDTNGIQSAADQSAASVIGSGTTEHEEKKKPVRMMGQNVKESVEEAAVKTNFKMPPESLQDKMYRQHQELRKQRGAPSPEEYKERIAQKQAEIDALKEGILDRASPKLPKPRNPADQVLRGKVNAAGKHLDKKRRQELAPKHKYKDPLAESLRPGEYHHFETDPETGKRVYKGIRGDQYDAPKRGTDDPAAKADQERKAHIQHDRGLTEQGIDDGLQLAFQGYKIKFTPSQLIISKGADVALTRPGDFSNPTKQQISTAKRFVEMLWQKDKNSNQVPNIEQQHNLYGLKKEYEAVRSDMDQFLKPFYQERSDLVNTTRGNTDAWLKGLGELRHKYFDSPEYKDLEAKAKSIRAKLNVLSKGSSWKDKKQSELDETIRKVGSQYRLLSKKGKNLGTFDSKAGAEKHEREVQYFKHMKEGIDSKFVVTCYNSAIDKEETILVAADDEYDAKDKINYALGRGSQIVDVRPARGDEPTDREYKAFREPRGGASRVGIYDRDQDVDEGWKGKLAGAALAGAAALGGGHADAQNIDLPGPQAVMIAHVQAEVNGREVNRTVNLGTKYQSEEQAEQDLEDYMQSKGITRYSIRIEQKYDMPSYSSNQPRGGTATGRNYGAPGIGDMVINRIGQEIRAGIPSKGGYATGGTNRGERPRDGSQWWRDQLPPMMREEALEEDIERHLLQMRRAGYDIVQEEWSDKYKDSINCSNPKGFSQKAHCAGKKKNEDVSEEKVRLDPKCWKGKKIGNPKTKMKGGVRVNNCVPK
jgi:hypothetical protein